MHVLSKTLVWMAALALGPAANAACYLVYAPDGSVVYRSMEPPVDLSMPLHVTMPRAAPGGRLVFALDSDGCVFSLDKLDTLHALRPARQSRIRPARRARGT